MSKSPPPPALSPVLRASIVGSAVLAGGLLAMFALSRSQLALAHGADSLADVLSGAALLWALRHSLKPPDDDHPFGHQTAQPVAALIVAVLIMVLGVEVVWGAVATLLSGARAALEWPLAAALLAKVALKVVLIGFARAVAVRPRSSIARAFLVDARNDVVLGLVSVGGFAAATELAMPTLDAWLAIPVALWVLLNGFGLGLESVHLLMGVAPSAARQEQLAQIARTTPGVQRVHALKARHHGDQLHVWLEVHVDPTLMVREAHDIGARVESRLLREADVSDAVVHVDAAT